MYKYSNGIFQDGRMAKCNSPKTVTMATTSFFLSLRHLFVARKLILYYFALPLTMEMSMKAIVL